MPPTSTSVIERELRELNKKMDFLSTLITGGEHPNQGIVVRLDRLEQSYEGTARWAKAAVSACLTTFIGVLIKMFLMMHKG